MASARVTRFSALRKRGARAFSSAQQDVIIVGGGPGGYVAAIKSAQLGLKTTCVEGRGSLGGTCLNVGCIPSKSLLNNSHLYHVATHEFAKRGIKVDGTISVDLESMMKEKSKSVTTLCKGIEGLFKKNKVTYSKGWGKITGANEVTVSKEDGSTEKLTAKNIVIATGSESTPLPGLDIDEKTIVTSTGALEFDSIPEHLVVVGGGVIGLEMGSVWKRLGSKVTVVEFLDGICPGTDREIATNFMKILKKQGLQFKLGTAVQSATKTADGVEVKVKNKKGEEETIQCDKVLCSIGRRPFTEGLGLEEMGVAMEGPGMRQVKVNDHWQSTTHPSIYAIGDVIKGPQLAHKAEEEGIAVAEILSGKPGHVNYNAIPGVIYTHPEVASVGKTEEELKEAGVDFKKGVFPMLANSRAKTIDDADGLVKILTDKATDRVLGVHMVGAGAGEIIQEGCIGIEYGASAEDLARTCHAHPTLSEAFKEACMAAYDKPIHF